jgi:magnesium-transporting ATPase (P-type)
VNDTPKGRPKSSSIRPPADEAERSFSTDEKMPFCIAGKWRRKHQISWRWHVINASRECRSERWFSAGRHDRPPPRSQAAVRNAEEAGIKAVMITGDHPVARRSPELAARPRHRWNWTDERGGLTAR